MKQASHILCRLFVGVVFILAGAMKVWNVQVAHEPVGHELVIHAASVPDPSAFVKDVANYQMLPHALTHLVAITLPWIEVVAGVLLLLGVWVRPSALIIGGLIVVFLIGITQALARGLDIHCGCFGTAGGRKVGVTALAEDVSFLAATVWIWWHAKD